MYPGSFMFFKVLNGIRVGSFSLNTCHRNLRSFSPYKYVVHIHVHVICELFISQLICNKQFQFLKRVAEEDSPYCGGLHMLVYQHLRYKIAHIIHGGINKKSTTYNYAHGTSGTMHNGVFHITQMVFKLPIRLIKCQRHFHSIQNTLIMTIGWVGPIDQGVQCNLRCLFDYS